MRTRTRRLALGLAALALWACDDSSPADAPSPDAAPVSDLAPDRVIHDGAPDPEPERDAGPPGCATTQRWAEGSPEIELWPDPTLLVADDATATGWRLDPDPARTEWIAAAPRLVTDTLQDLSKLNGFARSGGVIFRFDGPVQGVPSGWEATTAEGAAAVLLDLSQDPPAQVPFELETGEEGATAILVPMVPLKPGVEYAAILGPAITGADGGCVAAAPDLTAALDHDDEGRLSAHWRQAIERGVAQMGWSNGSVVAATAFVTQDARAPIVAAAQAIAQAEYTWLEAPACELAGDLRRCEAAFLAWDYRDDRAIFTAEAQPEPWRIPVTLWLPPADVPGPYPVLIYGHGIASRRGEGGRAGRLLAPHGFAVLATDALRHGDHPTATAESDGAAALDFLGVDLANLRVDGLALRGHFNQTALEKLQLIELARQAPDLDGDGTPELDPTRVVYWGISLGGMYGAPTAALADGLGAAVLSVAGGRLMAFATETEQVAPLLPGIRNLAGGEGPLQRHLTVLQTLVDGGDPAVWGAHILADRVRGEPFPLLMPVVLEDQVVPPLTNRALGRAMGLPHMAPVARPVDGLQVVQGPLRDNLRGLTAGYFQHDRQGDPPETATHNGAPTGLQGALQVEAFWTGWLEGAPVIIDPYAELGTPPLD
ncbi:MAG: hypothetical protein KC613_06990 [Myxococcales bacterium]|nr:hypothetical protein [Myxococcales bacterium]MCB9526338.1 hypothetical protein [Myxococcales bacterium]